MKKICILSNLHLSTNPRVWKEANLLAQAGYKVVILTVWTSAEKRDKDFTFINYPQLSYKAALNLIEASAFKKLYYRIITRFGREVKKKLNIDTRLALGFGYSMLKKKAIQENADLYIAHTEYGMLVGCGLIKRKKKVAFDFEDWYSRDYLIPSRPVKLLKRLEQFALTNGCYCSCPSKAMAESLQQSYNSTRNIHVIYNGFSVKEDSDNANQVSAKKNSLVWFSQTIGPGRGIETLLEALMHLNKKIELHLLGFCDKKYEKKIKDNFPFNLGHSLFFHSPVSHNQLINILQQHSAGLAIEQKYPESRDKTITNKVLQYLQAGIKVLATATSGQTEVAEYFPETVILVPFDDPVQWAKAIEKALTSDPVNKEMQLQKFRDVFSWEAQEEKLLKLVANNS